ncbi:MAG TPA: preprotein translocase subunit SecY [Verrucomicrobiae bacterium]|nr:preprotein translocase subunit SecY [Verrucomicrobiae bacterium]
MFRNIFNTFANCLKIPELKSRIIFTILVLAVCRLAAFVPIPGLNGTALAHFFAENANKGGVFSLYSMFSGGALENCAIGALGIMPYISATIIIQLLTAVIPTLSKLAREENGRAQIIKYSRYLTVLLCIGWGAATAISWEHPQNVFSGYSGAPLVLTKHLWMYRVQTILVLTTGTMLLLWLGEQITERGVGNGVSLIITVNILARLPQAVVGLKDMFTSTGGADARLNLGHAVALLLLLAGVIAGCIAITQAQRKIPVQYAQRAVGRKMYQGGTSFMPLRVNYAGVMPVIFASAILMLPQKIFQLLGQSYDIPFFKSIGRALDYGAPWYLVLYGLMILFFSYFWVATQFNELQIADDLKKNGGYIPGVRPGQATSDYLHNTMSRITLAGAVFLTVIAVIPIILFSAMQMPQGVAQFFGGTSLLITVGVMLDTMRQMESHLMMRHYDGFLKKGKMRGRFS